MQHACKHLPCILLIILATIHQLLFAGKGVIMQLDESIHKRVELKLKGCVSDSQRNQWLSRRVNSSPSPICEYIRKCSQPYHKIYIELAWLAFEDKDIDRST